MPRPKAAGAKAQKAAQEAALEPDSGAPAGAAAAAPEHPEEPAAATAAGAPPKKKRNANPGVRVQGGRVYDSEKGTTCHQCRQKTIECKAKCTTCTLYFCPKCLENRYQEQVEAANAAGDWRCPRCRGDCNCSNCRKKQGKEATGQLANIAKKAGFGSVKDLLQKNPNAKAIQLPRPATAGAGEEGAGGEAATDGSGEGQAAAGAARKRAPKRKAVAAAAAAAEQELVDEAQLPPRSQPMPEPQLLAVHKAAAGGSGAAVGSRRRGGAAAWVAGVPKVTAVPEGQAGAELAVVLEFLQVFGPKLQLRSPSLAAFAAELLQPALEAEGEAGAGAAAASDGAVPVPEAAQAPGGQRGRAVQQQQKGRQQAGLLCTEPEDSLVGVVHCRLLELVREYWNVKGGVSASNWQGIMRAYYAASLLTQRQALGLRWEHGPPAVAGQMFTRPRQAAAEEGEEAEGAEEEGAPAAAQAGGSSWQLGSAPEEDGEAGAALGAAPAAAVDFPGGSYWALPPAARISMLHALVNDALECGELRQVIEESMGDALDEEKERRQQLAGVRKEAREAIARERDQQIALLIASSDASGLTLEQQQQMLEQARQRAEAAAATAAAAKVKALAEKVHPPTVRAAVVGSDREGRRYLQLQVAPLLTGGGGVVLQAGSDGGSQSDAGPSASAGSTGEEMGCYPTALLEQVAAALHPQGRREGPLQASLVRAFNLPEPAAAAGPAVKDGEGALPEQRPGAAAEPAAAAAPTAASTDADGVPAKGRQKAAAKGRGRATSGSPALAGAAASGTSEATGEAAAAAAAAGKRRGRQSSEAGSSAERAAPKRQRVCAPAAVAQRETEAEAGAAAAPKKATARGATQRSSSTRAAGRGGKRAAAAGGRGSEQAASLPLKVDDMLTS